MSIGYEIRHHLKNKTNSLPQHWDIHVLGEDDAIITVWGSHSMAVLVVQLLSKSLNQLHEYAGKAPGACV